MELGFADDLDGTPVGFREFLLSQVDLAEGPASNFFAPDMVVQLYVFLVVLHKEPFLGDSVG